MTRLVPFKVLSERRFLSEKRFRLGRTEKLELMIFSGNFDNNFSLFLGLEIIILDLNFHQQTFHYWDKMSDRERVQKFRNQAKRTKSVHFNIPRSEYYSVPPVSPRRIRSSTKWSIKCALLNVLGIIGVIVISSIIIKSFQFG